MITTSKCATLPLLLVLALLAGVRDAAPAQGAVLANYVFRSHGWATFGLVLPPGAATDGVRVGALPTQSDVKVRWPDGSIRFAVVTAYIDHAGSYAIVPGPRSGAPMRARAMPRASVWLTVDGRAYTAALPAFFQGESWLAGDLVSEQRLVVAPGMHPFLRVIFDVRAYATGEHRVDVTVENTLDVAEADAVRYDVNVSLDGVTRFQQAGVHHKFLARWRKVFAAASLREAEVVPDFTPFYAAHALPAYLPTIASPRRALNGAQYGILEFGDLTRPMNAHGGRPEIAPYPDWTAQYLVHKEATQHAYMLRQGELAGSWGVHLREADGRSLISIDARPTYWLDVRAVDNEFEGPANRLRGRAEPGDMAHQPSLAYVPYLVTGDRFFADEVAFWANFCLIGTFSAPHARNGAQGLLLYHEVRGIGWALRNLGDAAAYLPDTDPQKPILAAKVLNNLAALQEYAATFRSGPVQTLFPGRRPEDDSSRYAPFMWIALWEQAYLAWSVDHVMRHGSVTPQVNFATAGAAIRDRIARLQLRLFTDPAWPADPVRQAPYVIAAGQWRGTGANRFVDYFQSLADVASATFRPADPGRPPDFVRPLPGYYGPEARLLLMISERAGEPGASAALAALIKNSHDGVSMADDLNRRSGWAIAPPAAAPSRATR